MTTDDPEVYFPRGGFGSETNNAANFKKLKTRKYLFEKKRAAKVLPKKPRKRIRDKLKAMREAEVGSEEDDESDVDLLDNVETLSYQSLTPGTLILATVNSVFNDFIKMDLPNRLSGRVNVKDAPCLSQPNKVKLKGIFKPGENYACKVLKVVREPKGFKVDLSLDPCCVNSDFRYDQFKDGSVFMGSLLSEEDHGFRVESGVKGLTCFLPKKYLSGENLEVGKIVWCCVKTSKISENTNRVEVTTDLNEISMNKLVDVESTDQLYPGAQVDVIVLKAKKQRIQVKSDDSVVQGFIEFSGSELPREGTRLTCTVLYKSPLVEYAGFTTKLTLSTVVTQEIAEGAIFERAEIVRLSRKGMDVRLKRKSKSYDGFITMRRLQNEKDLQLSDLIEQFPVGNHIKVRVVGFNFNDQTYSCTIESRLLNEKFISTYDLEVGQLVQFTVDELKPNGFAVTVGAVRGFLPKNQITEVQVKTPESKIKLKSHLKGRVLKVDHKMHSVMLTMRPSLVEHKPLTDFSRVKKGEVYFGTVVHVDVDRIRVSFFNNLTAYISQTDLIMRPDKYAVGEIVKCYAVTSGKRGVPRMSLTKPVDQMDLSIGESYTVIIKEIKDCEIVCLLDESNFKGSGLIPVSHLSDHSSINVLLLSNYTVGSVISNVILVDYQDGTPVFSLRKSVVDFIKRHEGLLDRGSKVLSLNDYVPCSVSEIGVKQVLLSCPIPKLNKKIPVNRKVLEKTGQIAIHRPVMTLVSREGPEFDLKCQAKDPRIWKNWSVDYLSDYLQILSKYQTVPIGSRVTVRVKNSKKGIRLKLNTGREVILEGSSAPTSDFPAVVLFDSLSDEAVHVVHTATWEKKTKKSRPLRFFYENETVLIGKHGETGRLTVAPRRVTPNDVEFDLSLEKVSTEDFLAEEIRFERGYSLCYLTSKSEQRLPENAENSSLPNETKKRKSENGASEAAEMIKKRKLDAIKDLSLEGVGGFDLEATSLTQANSRDVTDDETDDEPAPLKKKLTPSEKKRLALEEEKSLRRKEEELLKAEENPQSAEHFDRLLLGQPNSSKLWIQYMAFYLQSAEIDRARAVAHRALKQINARFDKEKLNVWLALLNLDHSYSPPEVFKKTFSDALQHNDDYSVNMRVLELYSEASKAAEIDQLTNSLVRKYKTKLDCWLKCQSALMNIGLYDKARSFLQRSLAALPVKEHVTLISRFALMENKYGFAEQAQSLFENIVTTYPLRIDLWFVYVDMLVKSNLIPLARSIFERASSNKLPIRKLRAIYKKWLEFETNHGNLETMSQVSEAAKAYLSDWLGTRVEDDAEAVKSESDRAFVKEELSDDAEDDEDDEDDSDLSDDDD